MGKRDAVAASLLWGWGVCWLTWEARGLSEMRGQRAVDTQSGSWMRQVLRVCSPGAARLLNASPTPHSMEGRQPLVTPGTEGNRDPESERNKTVDTRKPC